MKARIFDIAARAKVSTATVDRVINRRAGVSANSRQKVLEAAKDLGYLPNSGIETLPAKPVALEFFIPVGTNAFLADLTAAIEDFCERLPLVSSCKIHRLHSPSPEDLAKSLEYLSLKTEGVGVVAVDHPKSRELLREVVHAGVRVVTIASDIPYIPRSSYVGIDNRIAGRTAAHLMGRILPANHPEIVIVLGVRAYRGHEEREAGFRSLMAEDFPQLKLIDSVEVNDNSEIAFDRAKEILQRHPGIGGIYCVGGGREGVVDAISAIRPNHRPLLFCHDLTHRIRQMLLARVIDVVIDQNARLMAEQATIQLLGSIATSAPYLTKKLIEPRIIVRENIPVV